MHEDYLPSIGRTRLERDFLKYHKKNPHIWMLFQSFANQAVQSGRKQFSAKAIVERIRWHCEVETKDPLGFKLQNSMTAYYARLWQSKYPNKRHFFKTRVTEAEKALRPYQGNMSL